MIDKTPIASMLQHDHERVHFYQDQTTGLKAIVAIHNTVLGPGIGGTRFWAYSNETEALEDVLALSRGMTFKSALAGLDAGGAKAVIIGDPNQLKSEALLRKFGAFVDALGGVYITAPDINTNQNDMVVISKETDFVASLPFTYGGGGDPSIVTAYGTYLGMKATAKKVYGSDELNQKKVGIQGIGKVGMELLKSLVKEGAEVFVTDISEERLQAAVKEYGVTVVEPDAFYDQEMDIYSPCAMGGTLNETTINRLRCQAIVGAANNQIKDDNPVYSKQMMDKGIVYAPDFLVNAGGVINVYSEYEGEYNHEWVYEHTECIYDTCFNLLQRAEDEGVTTNDMAEKIALERIDAIKKVSLGFLG